MTKTAFFIEATTDFDVTAEIVLISSAAPLRLTYPTSKPFAMYIYITGCIQ